MSTENKGPFYAPGRYWCRGRGHAWGRSKNKGTPQLEIRFDPRMVALDDVLNEAGEVEAQWVDVTKFYERTIWLYCPEGDERAFDFLLKKLRETGHFESDDLSDFDLTGKDFVAVCKHETFEGKVREKWDLPLPAFESRPLEDDASVVRKLNTIYGKRLRDNAAGRKAEREATRATAPPPAALPAEPGGGTDDDIPF